MKIGICDLCCLEKTAGGAKKLVESKYRWGFKGGFKLDLCDFHTKVNNPFKGLSRKDAESAYFKMRFGKDDGEVIIEKVGLLIPTKDEDLEGRLEHAGDNVPKIGRGGRP